MNNQNFIPNCSLVEILITPSSGNTPGVTQFTEQSEFMGRKIVGIQSFCIDDQAWSYQNSNVPVCDLDQFKGGFLSIQRVGDNTRGLSEGLYYKNMPLTMLRAAGGGNNNASGNYGSVCWFKPFEFQWNQSKITYPTPVAMTEPVVIPFMFYYLTKEEYQQYLAQNRR
jgi:hypothetical protein